ncbi:MAG: threonine/serine dehydratase [Gemmataceae bacterium]
MLELQAIREAQGRIRGMVHRTPLVSSQALSDYLGVSVFLKVECLQKTGSFKPRGAFNKLLSLSAEERQRGVVAVSGGNHAQGVAYAAQRLGCPAIICMPETTPANYVNATRGYGAEIVFTPDIRAAFAETDRLVQEGRALIHPFDDPLIAAGQGTIGLEILEDLPDVTRAYVSIGGGGLISGVATALRRSNPAIEVIGVETAGADAMARSLAENRLVELPAITSIARTLGAPKVSAFTFQHVKELVAEVVVVDDATTVKELEFILERTKYLVEPSAACCLAAAARHRERWRPDDKVLLLLCGGNLSVQDLCAYHQRFMTK